MKKIIGLLAIMMLGGCATTKSIQIDYSAIFTGQESAYQFKKITSESDNLFNPNVEKYLTSLSALSDTYFDVDTNEDLIAFLNTKKDGNVTTGNIFIKNLNSLQINQQRTFQDWVFSPSISHNGEHLAYVDKRNGQWDIFLVGAKKGAIVRQISNTVGTSNSPTFSPDDKKIFYSQYEITGTKYNSSTGSTENVYESFIWSYDIGTGALIQYGKGYQPSFFPDGKRIAILRTSSNYPEIWIMDIENGTEYTLFSDPNRGPQHPRVSPDGSKVLFALKSTDNPLGLNYDIYLIDSDGTGFTQITFHPGHDFNPVWSKDGKSIYFMSQRGTTDGKYNIWKINVE